MKREYNSLENGSIITVFWWSDLVRVLNRVLERPAKRSEESIKILMQTYG
jgi:hypothetical protein